MLKRIILLFSSLFFACSIYAASNSVVGFWQTQDEDSKQPASLISIEKSNGSITGKVVKLYNNPNAVCSKCSGNLHNKPVLGLPVLWDFTPSEGGAVNGKILAIKRGAVLDANLSLQQQGQQLLVQIKTPFGVKTQIWQRVSAK